MVSRAFRIVWWCSVLAGKLKVVVIFKAIQVCWTWCDRELQFWVFLLARLVEPERQLGSVTSTFAPETCL